jgi:predicted  nucleic acid-binding Zn-ribbon protein
MRKSRIRAGILSLFSFLKLLFRSEHELEVKKRQEEIASLKVAVNKQTRAYNELKISKTTTSGTDVSTSSVVAEKISRIRQLEEDVVELQASLDELSHQLAETRNDAQNNLRTLNATFL